MYSYRKARKWLKRNVAARAGLNGWVFRAIFRNSFKFSRLLRMPHSGLQAVIYVDPLKIKYKCNIRGEDAGLNTLFRPGNWDQERFSFEDVLSSDPRYISCRELMEANLPIEHTHEYATMIDRLERRGKVRGLKSPSAILQYLEGIRRMYRQVVREKRLRSQRELGQPAYGNEINFAIGRDGGVVENG